MEVEAVAAAAGDAEGRVGEGVGAGAGGVGGGGEGDAGVGEAGERGEFEVVEAEAGGSGGGEHIDEGGLDDGAGVERGEAGGLVGGHDDAVLEAGRCGERGGLQRVQGGVDADVAEGMDGDGPAALADGAQALRETWHEHAQLDGLAVLQAPHGGLGAAVGEELDRAEAEALIAVAGGEALDEGGIGVVEEVGGVGQGEDGDR